MIEFKAECGHTVRARDEDAGGVVRCSYCGRDAAVPDSRESELDYLFRELDEGGEVIPERRKRRFRKPTPRNKKARTAGSFDPFAIVLKLCYAALLIAIVVVVGRKWVLPLFRGPGVAQLARTITGGDTNPAAPVRKPLSDGQRRGSGPGLMQLRRPDGLYVTSTPSGARGYCLEEGRAPTRGRIFDVPGVQQFQTDGECPRAMDGAYVVELAFPWNEPRLNEYPDYWSFRRSIEHASDEERRRLVEEYFMPDDATDAFVHQTEDQIYIVRQYHATVRHGKSKGVQALFLPRIARPDGRTFAIESLVANCLPDEKSYEFNEGHVRNELAFYGVPQEDRDHVLEALARIGAVAYVTPDGRTRLFKIGMNDGIFATKVVREKME